MFITVDVLALKWLATMVHACGASVGHSDFYKSRHIKNQVLFAQRWHNIYDRFYEVSEYGNEMRCGSIVILEGLKGKGWRHFIALLKEIVSSSSAFLDETKQFHRGLPHSSSRVGYEGILCGGFDETVKLV